MERELLEQPFSPEQIKTRAGNFGKTLSYIEGWAVIQRLNEAFGGKWSFTIESHDILESEVIVLGKLSTGDTIKTQFGSSSVTRAKNSGDIISLADDLKAAATDSLKKCATLYGVGLHLYAGKASVAISTQRPSQSSPVAPETTQGHSSHNSASAKENNYPDAESNGGNENGRLSNKQYNYLLTLSNNHGLTRKQLDHNAINEYGSVVAYLSKGDASNLIQNMLEHH